MFESAFERIIVGKITHGSGYPQVLQPVITIAETVESLRGTLAIGALANGAWAVGPKVTQDGPCANAQLRRLPRAVEILL